MAQRRLWDSGLTQRESSRGTKEELIPEPFAQLPRLEDTGIG